MDNLWEKTAELKIPCRAGKKNKNYGQVSTNVE